MTYASRVRLVTVGVIVLCALSVTSAGGAAPRAAAGVNGDIFYIGANGTELGTAVWRVHPDGTAATKVPGTDHAWGLRVSPDGTQMVYSLFDARVWVANTDGSSARQVPVARWSQYPSWLSPDAVVLSAGVGHRSGRSRLFRVSLVTGIAKRIRGGAYSGWPAVSPDGRTIVFFRRDVGGLWLLPSKGGTPVPLFVDGSAPAWSPDGTKIAYVCDGLCVVNADGSDPHQIWHPDTTDINPPSWSPDGTQIAVSLAAGPGSPNYQVWRVNADGSGAAFVTSTPWWAILPNWTTD
jgi:Tol biopolymer transport system component